MSSKVVAIIGSYRRNGCIDRAVEAVLAGAREKGAETQTIFLTEQQINFCSGCRQCVQTPGPERGKCSQLDDLASILEQIEAADAIVLGSPVYFYNTTAIFRCFLERLLGYYHWPWKGVLPRWRKKSPTRKAVLVASSAMPGFLIPLFTKTASTLRLAATALGMKPVASLWIGRMADVPHPKLSERTLAQAQRIGWKLA